MWGWLLTDLCRSRFRSGKRVMLGDRIVVVARLPRCTIRRRIRIGLVAFWRVRSGMDMLDLAGRVVCEALFPIGQFSFPCRLLSW
jgi:hypothetical protein